MREMRFGLQEKAGHDLAMPSPCPLTALTTWPLWPLCCQRGAIERAQGLLPEGGTIPRWGMRMQDTGHWLVTDVGPDLMMPPLPEERGEHSPVHSKVRLKHPVGQGFSPSAR